MKQVCISNVQTCFFISAVQIFTLCQEINPALFRNFILFLNLRNRCCTLQVASSIDDPDTFRCEVDPLLKIKDAYPKMILTRTRQEAYQHEGVQIIDVADWLLRGPT